ncbi:hypothetical protein LT493_30535 [Streptomyces tricolor]|nr:hypothetical protein [Streptomyces tricolor]
MSTSGSSPPRSRASGCAPPCWTSTPSPPAAAPSRTSDGSRYRVGPDSAGAAPGPACYRAGGPLTVTDANVMLGRIHPAHFPAVFGPGGDQPLDADLVRDRFTALAREIHARTGDERTPEQVAEGYLQIAVANIANAVSGSPSRRATTSPATP